MKTTIFKTNLGKVLMGALLALCFTSTAFAADIPENNGESESLNISTYSNDIFIDMQSITVYPTYKDSSGKLKTASGYSYDRTGNNAQGVFCTVSTTAQNNMKKNVESLGYTQVGYQINVKYTTTGTFTSGKIITKSPYGTPIKYISPRSTYTSTFYTELSSPSFSWQAGFYYHNPSNNVDANQLMQASATFAR